MSDKLFAAEQTIIQAAGVIIPAAAALAEILGGIAKRRGQTIEEICADTGIKSDLLRGRFAEDLQRLSVSSVGDPGTQ
jgi:hypothetical protein